MNGTSKRKPSGFTLVEILVVIVIIGILMGLAIPAIFGVIGTAKSTKMRLEVGALEDAIERYQQKYGDYPPDFSDWTIVERHYRKIFPRISKDELDLLKELTHDNNGNFDPTVVDRAQALHWALAGFSSNPIYPFTGDGGPIEVVSANNVRINMSRENSFYDFDPGRVDLNPETKDSGLYRAQDGSLFLSYASAEDGAPFVYFDARTYLSRDRIYGFNGYYGGEEGGAVRPYLSEIIDKSNTYLFANPNTFQIIAPGIDGNFGYTSWSGGSAPNNPPERAVYFQYPTGKAIQVEFNGTTNDFGSFPAVSGYREPVGFNQVDNFQQDNLTNFASAKLIDELEE